MNILSLPARNVQSIPEGLRQLATQIEEGLFADAHNLVWVIDCGDSQIKTGFLGASVSPGSEAYLLLGVGMRGLE